MIKKKLKIDFNTYSDKSLVCSLVNHLGIKFKHGDYKPIPYYLTQQEIDFIIRNNLTIDLKKLTPKQRAWMERCIIRLIELNFPNTEPIPIYSYP